MNPRGTSKSEQVTRVDAGLHSCNRHVGHLCQQQVLHLEPGADRWTLLYASTPAPGTSFSLTRCSDVAGEAIRQDVVEDQKGVPLALDIQIVDMDTCEPVTGAYLDIWRKCIAHNHQ